GFVGQHAPVAFLEFVGQVQADQLDVGGIGPQAHSAAGGGVDVQHFTHGAGHGVGSLGQGGAHHSSGDVQRQRQQASAHFFFERADRFGAGSHQRVQAPGFLGALFAGSGQALGVAGFAASGDDKATIRTGKAMNIGIVTAYNDMLSAHQPYGRYPEQIKSFAREVGATAQVAGGVPAMCDGVTQGQDSMESSSFSRDTIASSTSVALSHGMFE
ncbi:hypothetical protein OY671_009345, partial [Metschnikowia pulcherrima]